MFNERSSNSKERFHSTAATAAAAIISREWYIFCGDRKTLFKNERRLALVTLNIYSQFVQTKSINSYWLKYIFLLETIDTILLI